MKLTKNCFFPWFYRMIHAGGMICPCCAMGDTDYGDFILDYLEPKKQGRDVTDVLNNPAIVDLKRGLLTGELHPMCRNCALITQQMIPVETFKKELEERFEEWNVPYEKDADYAEIDAVFQIGLGLTNRCNLRCIYCNQSVLADVNPYFKVDFPEDEILDCLEDFAARGMKYLETGVFGEVTLHSEWCNIFTIFHQRHPEVKLALTTNLCRKYSEEAIELLAEHEVLRVSMETLDPELFARIRVNGRLELLLENLERIKKVIDKKHYNRSRVSISSVICNLTWRNIPQVSAFAFENGYIYCATNFEKRGNSVGIRDGILQSVEELDKAERKQVEKFLLDAQEYARAHGKIMQIATGLVERSGCNYHMFQVYDDNPIYQAFYEKYPTGTAEMHFAAEYDHLGQQHLGIRIKCGETLKLAWQEEYNTFVVREVHIYKEGTYAPKYAQKVFLDYKKKVRWENELTYSPKVQDENVEWVLLQVMDWWKEN